MGYNPYGNPQRPVFIKTISGETIITRLIMRLTEAKCRPKTYQNSEEVKSLLGEIFNTLYSSFYTDADKKSRLKGFKSVLEEYPANTLFYVPETREIIDELERELIVIADENGLWLERKPNRSPSGKKALPLPTGEIFEGL